jgi:hypothetical protein
LSEQEKKKEKRIHQFLRVGFVVLVVVVALAPLLLLIAYTKDINLFEQLWSRPEQEVETLPGVTPREPYTVQHLYRYCDHGTVHEPENIPPDLELPPAALVEMARALHQSDVGLEKIMSYLKDTGGWYVADMRVGLKGPHFTFTHLGDLCPDCERCYYLGIFEEGDEERIGVFQGKPPQGRVIRVTRYSVRDDLREKLEAGDIFESLDDLDSILEAYTS